jgi:hypothetical protein
LELSKPTLEFSKVGLEFSKLGLEFSKLGLEFSKLGLEFSNPVSEFSKLTLEFSKLGLEFSKLVLEFSNPASEFSKPTLEFSKPTLEFSKPRLIISQFSKTDKDHHHFQVEGIGYDFVPSVLDMNLVDQWEKTDDPETFQMARRLNCEEGLLTGGSSGAIMTAAMRVAKSLKNGENCVVILPDSVRNYLTKFLSDEWMVKNGCLAELPASVKLQPKDNYDTKSVYDPEKAPEEDFQLVEGPWKPKPHR